MTGSPGLEMEEENLPHFHIRPMRPEDLVQVHAIDQMSFTSPWTLNGYRHELLENPNANLWVAVSHPAEDQGKDLIVGVLVAWLVLDEVHIGTIAVHPAHRRQGIGAAMLQFALGELAARGAKHAYLEVRASNRAAQQLYQRFGFYEVTRRRGYYQDNGEDAILMNLDDLPRKFTGVR